MSSNATSDSTTGPAKETEAGGGFPFLKIPLRKEVFVGELATPGRWVVANVETTGSWPVNAQKFRYRGQDIWIIPLTEECYGAVAMQESADFDSVKCQKLLMRFLSAVAWVYEQGISVAHGFSGGSLPRPLGRASRFRGSITADFDLSDCPEPASDKALLALALMREGRALGHPAYSFLSFYRVLEVAFPDGNRRGEWIAATVPNLKGHFAKPAVDSLTASGITDIATYLREANRHAIAHARADPVIDPDDPAESRRLSQEAPIVIELATLAIEEVFGVETRHTIYRKHLYELAGFKNVIGDTIVTRINSGEQIEPGTLIEFPNISVGLRDRPAAAPLLNLQVREVQQRGKSLHVLYEGERVAMQFGLNFGEEKLEFEMLTDIRIRDDGTADGMSAVIEYTQFLNALFGNGQLHIFDADSGVLLGRKDAYIPMNMIFDHKAAEKQLSRLNSIEKSRRSLENGDWKLSYSGIYDWNENRRTVWKVSL